MAGWLKYMSKLDQLRELMRSFGSCLVAYSGGVDSAFLACVARQTLGDRAVAAIADTPSMPRRELQEALDLAQRLQLTVHVVHPREFENPNYVSNPLNRCYFCKHDLFAELAHLVPQTGCAVMVHGENADDVGDFRPGTQAAAEFQVRAPLKEVGLTKAEIRALSAELGLPTADKPQMACLSSRIPYGEEVTPAKLWMIEQAEYALRDLGLREVRVRHHELKALSEGAPRSLARIEVGPAEMGKLLANGVHAQIAKRLMQIGYAHVTLDLLGYRRGSANEAFMQAGNFSRSGVIMIK